jgi:hypothetical protein
LLSLEDCVESHGEEGVGYGEGLESIRLKISTELRFEVLDEVSPQFFHVAAPADQLFIVSDHIEYDADELLEGLVLLLQAKVAREVILDLEGLSHVPAIVDFLDHV